MASGRKSAGYGKGTVISMRNRLIFGILSIAAGLLLASGPQTIFPVCGVHEHSGEAMKCFWTARAELGVGLSISILGLFSILAGSSRLRLGLTAAVLLNGILALLFPAVLIGVCGSTRMSCRALSLPALSVLSGLIIVISIINGVYLGRIDKKGIKEHGKQTSDDEKAVGI